MRLVMLGYFGFGNAGDEAILAAEVAALRAALGADTSFVAISGNPAHTRATHGIDAVPRTDVRAIVRTLRRSDGLVAGGGSLLQDVTSARPVAFYAGTMLLARTLGKPVFVYAQGLGPINRPYNRRLAGLALRTASYVSLRDEASISLAHSLGVRSADLVPDPVLGLPLDVPVLNRLAVALRPWPGDWLPPLEAALAELAKDTEIVLVPFHSGQDVELAHTLAATIPATVIDDDPLAAVASSTATLGMRLHALITAAAANRPFVAISYDPKVTAFAEQVTQPQAATLPHPPDPETVITLARKALQGPDAQYLDSVAQFRGAANIPAISVSTRLTR